VYSWYALFSSVVDIKARTMQASLSGPDIGGMPHSAGKLQSYFLIAIAALQFLLIYFFCYISFSSPFVDAVNTWQAPSVGSKDVADLDFGEIQSALS
jgi:hypothetical protein